jgi:hypothetical protein
MHERSFHIKRASLRRGGPDDVPVVGDYDGDGISDITIFRPSAFRWYVLQSSSGFGTFDIHVWGAPGDIALPR